MMDRPRTALPATARLRRLGIGLLVVILSLALGSDATAKPKKSKAAKTAAKNSKKAAKDTAKTARKREQDADKPRAGDLDPATIPVVSGDLVFAPAALLPFGAPAAHLHARGEGVVIAVLDGGFDTNHPTIRDALLPHGFDVIELDADVDDLGNGFDDDGDDVVDRAVGHGTFVCGMVHLAAPAARILPVRIADDEGRATAEEIHAGILYALGQGVDVINLSVSIDKNQSIVADALAMAAAAGVHVVASAGNDGQSALGVMGAAETSVCVGACDERGRLAPFSNTGSGLDVLAPGVDLVGPTRDGALARWSGTSFATGFVSGAVALMLEDHPGATIEAVRARLRATGTEAKGHAGEPLPDTVVLDLLGMAGG